MARSKLFTPAGKLIAILDNHHNLNGFCFKVIVLDHRPNFPAEVDAAVLITELESRSDGMGGFATRGAARNAFAVSLKLATQSTEKEKQ